MALGATELTAPLDGCCRNNAALLRPRAANHTIFTRACSNAAPRAGVAYARALLYLRTAPADGFHAHCCTHPFLHRFCLHCLACKHCTRVGWFGSSHLSYHRLDGSRYLTPRTTAYHLRRFTTLHHCTLLPHTTAPPHYTFAVDTATCYHCALRCLHAAFTAHALRTAAPRAARSRTPRTHYHFCARTALCTCALRRHARLRGCCHPAIFLALLLRTALLRTPGCTRGCMPLRGHAPPARLPPADRFIGLRLPLRAPHCVAVTHLPRLHLGYLTLPRSFLPHCTVTRFTRWVRSALPPLLRSCGLDFCLLPRTLRGYRTRFNSATQPATTRRLLHAPLRLPGSALPTTCAPDLCGLRLPYLDYGFHLHGCHTCHTAPTCTHHRSGGSAHVSHYAYHLSVLLPATCLFLAAYATVRFVLLLVHVYRFYRTPDRYFTHAATPAFLPHTPAAHRFLRHTPPLLRRCALPAWLPARGPATRGLPASRTLLWLCLHHAFGCRSGFFYTTFLHAHCAGFVRTPPTRTTFAFATCLVTLHCHASLPPPAAITAGCGGSVPVLYLPPRGSTIPPRSTGLRFATRWLLPTCPPRRPYLRGPHLHLTYLFPHADLHYTPPHPHLLPVTPPRH